MSQEIDPLILLAALEAQGFLLPDVVKAIEELSERKPVDYLHAKALLTQALETLPVWERCGECLAQMVSYKQTLSRWHVLGHPVADG